MYLGWGYRCATGDVTCGSANAVVSVRVASSATTSANEIPHPDSQNGKRELSERPRRFGVLQKGKKRGVGFGTRVFFETQSAAFRVKKRVSTVCMRKQSPKLDSDFSHLWVLVHSTRRGEQCLDLGNTHVPFRNCGIAASPQRREQPL